MPHWLGLLYLAQVLSDIVHLPFLQASQKAKRQLKKPCTLRNISLVSKPRSEMSACNGKLKHSMDGFLQGHKISCRPLFPSVLRCSSCVDSVLIVELSVWLRSDYSSKCHPQYHKRIVLTWLNNQSTTQTQL